MDEIAGIIDHRILLNYRIQPDVAVKYLPSEFRPKLVNGYCIGGICQVSLSGMTPKGLPNVIGTRSHNAAHRIAVVTDKGEGVYVPRRDTNSWLNVLSGGLFFPGVHGKSNFSVRLRDDRYVVQITDDQRNKMLHIDVSVSDEFPSDSVFKNMTEVSEFFSQGNIGWSKNAKNTGYDTIALSTEDWNMTPLKVNRQRSGYFSDTKNFPVGSVEFDSAMIMRNIKHSWISKKHLNNICC